MTSWKPETAPAPHHDLQAAGDGSQLLQMPLGDGDEQGMGRTVVGLKMAYGTNEHPPLKDSPPMLIRDLPREYIPACPPPSPIDGPGGRKKYGKRLIVVGDVHGNVGPLKALLQKIDFNHKDGDHLILAGDMITKGPDSRGVIELAMKVGASAVRGNHEDRVLAAAKKMRRISVDGEGADEDDAGADNGSSEDGEAEISRKKDHARQVAKSLSRVQLGWLKELPIILRISQLPNATSPPFDAGTIVVVHGGLVPGLPLEKQDPWAVMNMRTLVYSGKDKSRRAESEGDDSDGYDNDDDDNEEEEGGGGGEVDIDTPVVPIDGRDGEPWSHAWNRYQNHLLPNTQATTLAIYGHDAKSGLQADLEVDISEYDPNSSKGNKKKKKKKKKKQKQKIKEKGLRYAFGLDSGCGHGRQLSALVIEAVGPEKGGVEWRIEQVEC
ncbi:Bis(5'-nucleosyl)-tetraphosphatase, symmetrical [Madurella mycetomatis]|uniref:Bis(5'-nucleosyl)-tetraphosphatase, symmetrical n=1 Tax=Madurella mycetomatis TaxID=100816 RepID=A0A175VWH4_9PEZI|nr:Bis(5'-nucleosyl)-tetraphosphatase, symmetrical [Madurella mycetomatis]